MMAAVAARSGPFQEQIVLLIQTRVEQINRPSRRDCEMTPRESLHFLRSSKGDGNCGDGVTWLLFVDAVEQRSL